MKFAKTFALTAIASSALMMGGCANNGYGYNSGLSNTAKGATAGAAVKTSLVVQLVAQQSAAQVLISLTKLVNYYSLAMIKSLS